GSRATGSSWSWAMRTSTHGSGSRRSWLRTWSRRFRAAAPLWRWTWCLERWTALLAGCSTSRRSEPGCDARAGLLTNGRSAGGGPRRLVTGYEKLAQKVDTSRRNASTSLAVYAVVLPWAALLRRSAQAVICFFLRALYAPAFANSSFMSFII